MSRVDVGAIRTRNLEWSTWPGRTSDFGQLTAALALDLIAQLLQLVRIILANDGSALLKVVHEENILRVPKDGSHDLACRLHHLGLPWSWRTVMP